MSDSPTARTAAPDPIADEPWREPVRGGYPDPALMALTGVEQLRAMLDGRVPAPPLARLTGSVLCDVTDGSTAFELPLSDWLCSPQGAISIGPLTIPADAAMATSIQTRLPAASPLSTTELSLRIMTPVRPGGRLIARGRIIQVRRTLALAEAELRDDTGALVGHGSCLCFVQPLPAGPRPAPAPDPAAPELTPSSMPARDTSPRVVRDGADPDPFVRPASGDVLDQDLWDRFSGLEVLAAQIAGELPPPPIGRLFGLAPREATAGTATFGMPASEWLCAPPRGRVQGGCVAVLAEAAVMGAIQTRLPAGTAIAPVDLKVNYVRPLAADGREATARGRVLHLGRRTAVASSEVHDADGKLVAIGTGSAMLLPGRPASLRSAGR